MYVDRVYFSADLIHSISRLRDQDRILVRFAESADDEVDGFIASIAQENLRRLYTFDTGELLLDFPLERIWVSVLRGRVGVFICIKENLGLSVKFVAGG